METEQNKYTICELLKEIQHLQTKLKKKKNEIMSLQADLVMAKDRINYLEGKDE